MMFKSYKMFPNTLKFKKKYKTFVHSVVETFEMGVRSQITFCEIIHTDYLHELLKSRKHIYTFPKLMKLNRGELWCFKKVFQVVSPQYLKYLFLNKSLNSDHSPF